MLIVLGDQGPYRLPESLFPAAVPGHPLLAVDPVKGLELEVCIHLKGGAQALAAVMPVDQAVRVVTRFASAMPPESCIQVRAEGSSSGPKPSAIPDVAASLVAPEEAVAPAVTLGGEKFVGASAVLHHDDIERYLRELMERLTPEVVMWVSSTSDPAYGSTRNPDLTVRRNPIPGLE